MAVSGPQYYYKETAADNGYILEGGYCMFFNYRFIDYFTNNPGSLQGFFTTVNKCKTDNCLHKLYANIFPRVNMGPYTHDIIQKIIQNCPLVNDIKEYKPSGNAKVNKVIKPSSPVKSYAPIRKARSHTRRAKKQPQCPAVCKGPNPPSGCMKCLRRLKYTFWGFDKRRKSRRKSRRRKSVRKSRRRKSRRNR